MSPTSGVIGEAWGLYKAHWQHLVTISAAVYLGAALVSLVVVPTSRSATHTARLVRTSSP